MTTRPSSHPSRKIVDAATLAATLRREQARGRRIVHCHGCFDIVHPGHVRYLQAARQLGDLLVVSLTGDAGISKGPDRPYIPQDLRAENLAALEFVDWVVIDAHPTACEIIEQLRPDIYVKGREYATSSDERFLAERQRVEGYGGRVVFHSGDVVFSSTRLIQTLSRDARLDACRLRSICQRDGINLHTTTHRLAQLAGTPVLVIGDAVRERYVLCDAREMADDAPAVSLQQLESTGYWGGAAGLAFALHALGARPLLVTGVGDDDLSQSLQEDCAAAGIECILPRTRAQLVQRTTFVSDDTRLFHVTAGASAPLDSATENRTFQRVRDALYDARALFWSDHGLGLVTPGLAWAVTTAARKAGLTTAGHAPAPRANISALKGTDILALSERRLREAMHDMTSGLSAVAWQLLSRTGGQVALVSLHKRGLTAFDGRPAEPSPTQTVDGDTLHRRPPQALPERLRSTFIPSLADFHADPLGSEEAALALATLTLTLGGSLQLATYLAAAAGSLAATRLGRSLITADELRTWLHHRPELRPESRFVLDESATAGEPADDTAVDTLHSPLHAAEPRG